MKKTKKAQPAYQPATNAKVSSNSILFIIGLLIVFLFSFIYIFNSKLDLNGDNFNYLILGKSLSQGTGYTEIYSPGMPPASHFPPGYPMILSIFMFLNVHSIIFFKIVNGLCLLGSSVLLFLMMKKLTGNTALSFIVGIIILLNKGLLSFATIIMSEMPYLFFSCLAFFALFKLLESEKSEQNKAWWKSPYFYALALSTVITYYIRSIGIVLLLSVLITLLLRKQWKISLAYVSTFILLYLPWIIRNKLLNIEGRYLGTVMVVNPWRPEEGTISTFGEFFQKLITNFDETVIKGFKEVMFPFMTLDYATPSGGAAIFGSVILLGIIFYGAWKMGKYRYLFVFYILGNIATFMLWHGGNGARYVHPLAPFLLFCFAWGIYNLVLNVKFLQSYSKVVPYAFLILVFFMFKPLSELHDISGQPYPPAFKNYFNLAKYVKSDLSSQSSNGELVVCCRKPSMFSYYSECYATNYVYSTEPKEVIQGLLDSNTQYVVLEQLGYSSTFRYLYPAIQAHPELFEPVVHLPDPDTYLFRFNREQAQLIIKN